MSTVPLRIRQVFVQAERGIPSDEAFYKAWSGFRKRRIPCELFEADQLPLLPLARDTLVAGALRVVEAAMMKIGLRVPLADNLPACLSRYRGRRVWTSTWGELRQQYANKKLAEPLFVKPLRKNKGFPSIALYNAADFAAVAQHDDATAVLVSEYVLFSSEWRCFVCRGSVLGMCPYQGDVFIYPDARTIQAAIEDFTPTAPAGYAMDFGVLSSGKTVLVEVNEGYSLGSYSLNSVEYSELLEARWLQLAQE